MPTWSSTVAKCCCFLGLDFRSLNLATHRPQSSSFLGLPCRILIMNPKKELLWGLWVHPNVLNPNQQNSYTPNPTEYFPDTGSCSFCVKRLITLCETARNPRLQFASKLAKVILGSIGKRGLGILYVTRRKNSKSWYSHLYP